MNQTGQAEKGAADYGREALSQWTEAARYGVRALAARREAAKDGPGLSRLKERLDPTKTDKGGKAGDMADLALSKLGRPGRLASQLKMGSRLVERVAGSGERNEPDEEEGNDVAEVEPEAEVEAPEANGVAEGDGVGAGAPLPIQASIDVALPVAAVFDLCTRFEDYPQIVDRVNEVEIEDDTHFTVVARVAKRPHELAIELLDELPEERLDWECTGELEHSGVLTIHPLAPRLTRLELTIERDSEGLVEHLGRILALPERVLKQELRRFKAVAELWEEGKNFEPAEIGPLAVDEGANQEPGDEDLEEQEEEPAEEPEPEEEAASES
jgi:uncharacterized membrane protein